jgi:peptidoglycan hydrolase-like protein with peptidoglycan-binding domain
MAQLSKGMTGPGVQDMQNDLMSLGFDIGSDSLGQFGNGTYKAVKDFQYTWGSLTIDGVVGSQTAASLKEAMNLLMQGQWDPGQDPLSSPSQIQATNIPQPPRVESTVKETPGAGTTMPSMMPSIPPLSIAGFNIDWKWIGLGMVAVFGILKMMKKDEG